MDMQVGPNTFTNPLKTKRKKFGFGSLLLLVFMGALFLVIGIAIYNASKINPSWTHINGTVVGSTTSAGTHGTTYNPTISYTVNGQTYKITSSLGSSSYPVTGSQRQVAYDPAAPADAKVVESATSKTLALAFAAIGALLIVLAPVLFIRSLHRTHDINQLKQTGQKIQGVITDIQQNDGGNNNSVRSYRIVVSATAPNGTVQSYNSDWMTGIGALGMADFRNNPIPIDLYINPANPQDYYVDISDIPNITPERIKDLIAAAARPQSIMQGAPVPPISPSPVPSAPQPIPSTPSPPIEPNQNEAEPPPFSQP
jgi:hypothetical protein